jgi:hypothetical protein
MAPAMGRIQLVTSLLNPCVIKVTPPDCAACGVVIETKHTASNASGFTECLTSEKRTDLINARWRGASSGIYQLFVVFEYSGVFIQKITEARRAIF